MSLVSSLLTKRAGGQCELCGSTSQLGSYTVPPKTGEQEEDQVVVCSTCLDQIEENEAIDPNHWRCLNESMWSGVPAVQVVAYRQLKKLAEEGWAADLLNQLYLDPVTLEWAQQNNSDATVVHKDSNGNVLEPGDSVVLIKDLKVKGANFTAKRGTAVRRIRLDPDNAEYIEGKVDGQQIVILTKYVKKI